MQNQDAFVVVTNKKEGLIVNKIITYHENINNEQTEFDINQESDGTRRAISLIPTFLELILSDSPKVFFIDELYCFSLIVIDIERRMGGMGRMGRMGRIGRINFG